jgi:hypothetical protein
MQIATKTPAKSKNVGKKITKDDTITVRLRIDSRGRFQIKQEDRDFLQLQGGELLEVTIKRANIT